MEEEYNWNLILKIAAPIALFEGYIFYRNIADLWKWTALIIGLFAAGSIAYKIDKKKYNIFTAVGIVFLAALIVRFLKNFGII